MSEAGRKNVMLGTAGHVDHGKTALVKMLTGCDTDRLAEEKQRGLTIELGFAPCLMPDQRIVGIVDVPGHVGFIKNMVAGAHGVDVVILVVAADDGVMPQTREHLDILTLMGVRHGLVAVTKIDLVDDEMRKLVFDDVRQFVAGTFLEGKAICGVSSITGEGFDAFLTAMHAAVEEVQPHDTEAGLFRLWIEREFGIHGFGAVVSGIPTSGQVRVGQRVRVLPGGATARLRRLEVYGHDADVGQAGECVALNLAEIKAEELHRGCVLCSADAEGVFSPVTMFEALLDVLPSAPGDMQDYAEVHLHVGTTEVMANVAMLEGQGISPGRRGLVQLRCKDEVAVALRERLVVRGVGVEGRLTTLGGGRIVGLSNTRLRRKRQWTLDRLAALANAADDNVAWVAEHVRQAERSLSLSQIACIAQLPDAVVTAALKTLLATGDIRQTSDGFYLHRQAVDDVAERIAQALQAYHIEHPARLGAPREELESQIGVDAATFTAAVDSLIASGQVQPRGGLLALLSAAVQLTDEERQTRDELERILREAKLQPPSPAELAEQLDAAAPVVDKALQLLCDEGLAVRLDPKLVLHADAVAAAQGVLLELFRRQRFFETTEFRDALEVSRKFAVPLLDYFDKIRWTARQGNRRTPGREAKAKLEHNSD